MAINFTNRFHRGYVTPPPDSKSITAHRDRVAEAVKPSPGVSMRDRETTVLKAAPGDPAERIE